MPDFPPVIGTQPVSGTIRLCGAKRSPRSKIRCEEAVAFVEADGTERLFSHRQEDTPAGPVLAHTAVSDLGTLYFWTTTIF